MLKRFRYAKAQALPGLFHSFTIACLLVLSGCSLAPPEQPTTRDQIPTLGTQPDRFAYGSGFGESRERALQAARDELAEMILVNVRTETRQDLRDTEQQEITREFISSSFSWSNVELENVQVDYEQQNRNDGTWFVRLRIDRDTVFRLTQLARQKAPALNAVYRLEQAPRTEPAQRLERAILGYNIAVRDNVLKEQFITALGSQASFETYFAEVTEASVRTLRALPVLHENRRQISIALVHGGTATPQRGATFYLRTERGERELLTDSGGMSAPLSLRDLGDSFSVVMRVGDIGAEGPRIERFREVGRFSTRSLTNAVETTVYFYVNPSDANVRVNNESLGSPVRHVLVPGKSYQVAVRSERFREQLSELKIPRGAAFAFVRAELEARQFGSLALSVADRAGRIEVRRDSDLWERSESNQFERELAEAGSYAIRVGRASSVPGELGFDPEYQIVQDLVELQSEQRYSVEYPEPAYREPYNYGWRVGVYSLRGSGDPSATYRIPYARSDMQGTDGHYGQFYRDTGQSSQFYLGSANDFVLNVQRYFDTLNFTMQGNVGVRTHQFNLPNSLRINGFAAYGDRKVTLDAYHASIGVGFWKSFYSDMVLASVTVNQGYDYTTWDEDETISFQTADGATAMLPSSGSATNSYAFVEANAHFSFGGGLGITASVVFPIEMLEPSIQLGFAYSFFESGYRKPAMIPYQP